MSKRQQKETKETAAKRTKISPKDYAVLAVVDSELLRVIVLANKRQSADGRIRFTAQGMYIMNYDVCCTQMVNCYLKREAFSTYHCAGREIIVDCSLQTLCNQLSKSVGKDITACLMVPHSTNEKDRYGPIYFQFKKNSGKGEVTSLKLVALDLDMTTLDGITYEWIYRFQLQHKEFKNYIDQLATDKMADRVRLLFEPHQLTLQNDNPDDNCPKSITLPTDDADLAYHFTPPSTSSSSPFSIILSRTKLQHMLDVSGVSTHTLLLQGNERIFQLQYLLPDDAGHILFILATMLSESECL